MAYTNDVRTILAAALAVIVFAAVAHVALASDVAFNGPGYQYDIRAIGIAPNGEVWVGSSGSIAVFSADGKFVRYETNMFRGGQINSIIFQPDGTPIYGENDGNITVIGEGGDRTKDVVMGGFGNYAPWEVARDKAGNLFATDVNNSRIMSFNMLGTQLATFATAGSADVPAIKHPFSLAIDDQDRIFVTDQDQPGLWVYGHDGTFSARLMPTTKFWRLKMVGKQLYATSDAGVEIIDPATGTIIRHIDIPAGYSNAMGFAVDSSGDLFAGNFIGGLVHEYDSTGKLLRTLGPSYKLTLSIPDSLPTDHPASIPIKLENPIDPSTPAVMPNITMTLLPAESSGEPDLNFVNYERGHADPGWAARRLTALEAQGYPIELTQVGQNLQASLPAATQTGIYSLAMHADSADPTTQSQTSSARVIRPGQNASLTLLVPRERSVFQIGEQIEVNVILRSAVQRSGGLLDLSMHVRAGDTLAYAPDEPAWKQFSVPPMTSGTLTYFITSADINPGRYVLQAHYRSAGSDLHDVWPITIVSPIQETRFRILFPEWSAGYTDIWGPFDGAGMQLNAAQLAGEGINQYDTCVVQRGMGAMDYPMGASIPDTAALVKQAQADPALPAPERFAAPQPFEIELQEALRNHMSVQRDFWGSHMLDDWGFANPFSIPRDNRIAQMWTQWQREWPSWVGHRYLTLSLSDENDPEVTVIKSQLTAQNIIPPTQTELEWARNDTIRKYISDAPHTLGDSLLGIGTDAVGNIYIGSGNGTLMKFSPSGKLMRSTKIPGGLIDIAVTANGTVWGAHMGGGISTTTPDGVMTSVNDPDFGSYSPRGVTIAPDGTLLFSDEEKGNIRRFTQQGKLLAVIGSKDNLTSPGGLTTTKDGTIYVVDGGRGGTMTFKADGTPLRFLRGMGGAIPGGKPAICTGPDDTLWVSMGGSIGNFDRDGHLLRQIGRTTFAPGGMSLITGLDAAPDGNLLMTDVAIPWATEMTTGGDLVRIMAAGALFADVRIDRQRYTFADKIIASVWQPLPELAGDPANTITAYAQPEGGGQWLRLSAVEFAGRNFQIAVPQLEGKVTLRLVYGPAGSPADYTQHADYAIDVESSQSPADEAKLADIVKRRRQFDTAWIGTRMGTLVRWTNLSDRIRPGTQDTAPTNYGTPDNTSGGVWVPWRRDALVAEAENEGHDFGTYTLMGSWYVARALEGPDPKPAWSSLLSGYWDTTGADGKPADLPFRRRPERDYTMLLGAGASGIGTGLVTYALPPKALATHRKMVKRLQRLGEATMAIDLPGKGGVAVLHSYTQETMDSYNDEQFYTAQAAWYDLLRAHIPTAVISEESIASGALIGRFKAVLIPDIHFALPADTMEGLAKFEQSGGEVWVDLGTRFAIPGAHLLKTKYRPFWIEDAYYNINNGYGVGAYDGNSEYVHMKSQSDLRLPAIREAFGRFAISAVTFADPNIFEMERKGGGAVYDFVGNDHYPDTPLYKSSIGAQTPVPASATIHFAGGAVYDAYAEKRIVGDSATVDFTDDEPAKVYVTLPSAIASVSAHASFVDGKLVAQASVRDASGTAIGGVIPIEITVTDSAGHVQYHLYRATGPGGTTEFGVPVGWPAPSGRWSVTVKEMLSDKSSEPAVADVSAHLPPRIEPSGPSLIFDAAAIEHWLTAMHGQEVWIPLDTNQTALATVAAQLAKALGDRGINAKVVNIADFPEQNITLDYTLAAADQAVFDRVKAGQAVGLRVDNPGKTFRTPGPRRMIMRPMILLGSPSDNRWLADIDAQRLTRRQISPFYPGPNRGLVQFCWAPFYDGFDAVTIGGTDVTGVTSGINTMLSLAPTQ